MELNHKKTFKKEIYGNKMIGRSRSKLKYKSKKKLGT
jgi:hypothetical protein